MASLLPSDIANIVANAFAGQLMTGTLRRVTTLAVDANGDPATTSVETFAVQGIRDNFNARYLSMMGIPVTDVKILLIMNLIVPRTIPRKDDEILIRDQWHKVREVLTIDPASASVEMQCFVIDDPT